MKYLITAALLFITFTASAGASENFYQLTKGWERDLSQLEKEIEKDSSDKQRLKEHQAFLREIKDNAAKEVEPAKESLANERQLLAALGDVPENPEDETAAVRQQRNKLNNTISTIDAKIKQANLIIAKANDALAMIDSLMKKQVQERIFAYESFPSTMEGLEQVYANTKNYFSSFENWLGLGFLMLGLVFIGSVSLPLTKHLNGLIKKAPGVESIRPLNYIRLMMLGFAAYFVFLMRFGIIDIQTAPEFENLLEIIASICLAVILFIALGRVRFVTPKLDTDVIGEQKKSYSWLWNGFKKITRLVLLAIPIMSIFGYANLALYLAFNILATIVAMLIFVWLRMLAVKLIARLAVAGDSDEEQEDEKELSPFAITIMEPIFAVFAVGFALFFWGMTTEDLTSWVSSYKEGVPIGDVTIDFVNLGSAVIVFFAIILVTRLIQWFVSKRVFPYTDLDLGLRDAISAITGYIGIVLAVLIAMGAVGLDLSNLAIVAGALSVGIGFGLQAIFNNFVSGLILLFERPVKVGDWIVVGENQGIIKKIRVRSTEIETFQNASIIVPNSQLISETVTNWTLYDKVGRVDIPVGVAYGSDTEKVKEVLLKVASENPSVRQVPKPNVFFMSFGDSSLDFELRCFIRNIRDVFTVKSELRFAVDDAFRKHNIEIPFPQRDLHVKTLGEIKVNNEKPKTAKKPATKTTKKKAKK